MRVVADGRSLEAAWHGPRADEAITIVFLHEGLGSLAQWRDFPETLASAAGMGALVFSRAGYGRSDTIELPRPLDYMEHEGKVVMPQVLDGAGVTGAVLFGHSDGASIAIVTAGMRDPRIRGLILEAPHVFCEDLSVESIEKARDAYVNGDLRARLARYHDDVDAAFWGWNRAWLDPGFRAFDLQRYLDEIEVPVLAVQGEDDPYGTIAQVEAIERRVQRCERLLLPSCGHAPHRDKPDEVLASSLVLLSAIRKA